MGIENVSVSLKKGVLRENVSVFVKKGGIFFHQKVSVFLKIGGHFLAENQWERV